jgi:hypothetical protein
MMNLAFMKTKFSVTKEQRAQTGLGVTHTRIGDKKGIYGGSYHIPDESFDEFMEKYHKHVLLEGNAEYLTEKQLDVGPIAIDLDFRYDLEVKTRQHDNNTIIDILINYLDELKTIFRFTDKDTFPVYIMEKPNVYCETEKNRTKDGIHIIIGLHTDRATQVLLRKQMLSVFDRDIKIPALRNSWSDVLDEGVTKANVNWQMYGSGKPGYEVYKLVQMYECVYDGEYKEFNFIDKYDTLPDVMPLDFFKKMSVRNTGCLQLPLIEREAAVELGQPQRIVDTALVSEVAPGHDNCEDSENWITSAIEQGVIDDRSNDYNKWASTGFMIMNALGDTEKAFDLFDRFSLKTKRRAVMTKPVAWKSGRKCELTSAVIPLQWVP